MLEGSEAFAALARGLKGVADFDTPFVDPPFERLRVALKSQDVSCLDLAVLMRHALRFESLDRKYDVHFETNLVLGANLQKAGLRVGETSQGYTIAAEAWRPDWLPDSVKVPTDEGAMHAERHRFFEDSKVAGDPFLKQFELEGYRSTGQRSAVRAALGMPPGSSLIIDLPTGEGKSLVFRAVQKLGFADELPGAKKSLTVVVVPTVTLALDHERSCGGSASSPMAYVGGQVQRNLQVLEAIRSGDQELIFAAPEAIVGPLRHEITKVLEKGGLRSIIVDEAHLIEGWGTGFRTEFQTLAGLCHQWRSGGEQKTFFRLIFLSATFSEMASATLNELFSPDEVIPLVSAASIRPEPEFWVASPSEKNTRNSRVIEALYHLPRPAILYVTRVDDAEWWYDYLKHEIGFGRIRKVHGGTGAKERESVLGAWADGVLDVVVATSAFGLGVDYPHVRSVIHACMPEKLDRFYQEVGRGGRDGCTSISLLIPAFGDERLAKRLSQQKIITVDRGFQRWKAMFQSDNRIDLGDMKFGVRLDTAPGTSEKDIDLVGMKSIDWNARVLSMMARSGMLRLIGVPPVETDSDEAFPPYQGIQIYNNGHLQKEVWEDVFERRRGEIAMANAHSFNLLKRLASGSECPGVLISSLYPGCARACTSCRKCRLNPNSRHPSQIVGDAPLPWAYAPIIADSLKAELGDVRRIVVEYGKGLPKGIRPRDFEKALRRLDQSGFRVFVSIGSTPDWIVDPLDKVLSGRPWLAVRDREWRRPIWPEGNTIIFSGFSVPLRVEQLNNRESDFAEIVFVPEGLRDASNLERKVTDVLTVPVLSIRQFFERYLR
jgi:ATP-dependent DNA helicase RecQ